MTSNDSIFKYTPMLFIACFISSLEMSPCPIVSYLIIIALRSMMMLSLDGRCCEYSELIIPSITAYTCSLSLFFLITTALLMILGLCSYPECVIALMDGHSEYLLKIAYNTIRYKIDNDKWSIKVTIGYGCNPSINQWMNESINQSLNQSLHMRYSCATSFFWKEFNVSSRPVEAVSLPSISLRLDRTGDFSISWGFIIIIICRSHTWWGQAVNLQQ